MLIIIYVIVTFICGGLVYYYNPIGCFMSEERDALDAMLAVTIGMLWPLVLVSCACYLVINFLLMRFVNVVAFCDGFVKGIKNGKKSNSQ